VRPFKGERANLFGRYALSAHVDALTEQNLTVLDLAAEPRRDIAHSADPGVAGALRIADLAQVV
jgi:hypothetical protein